MLLINPCIQECFLNNDIEVHVIINGQRTIQRSLRMAVNDYNDTQRARVFNNRNNANWFIVDARHVILY